MMLIDEFDALIAKTVNEDRMSVYGHPIDHFRLSSKLKMAVREQWHGDPALLHPIEMILDKIARLANSPSHFDSWLDIAGYARTAILVLDATEKTKDD